MYVRLSVHPGRAEEEGRGKGSAYVRTPPAYTPVGDNGLSPTPESRDEGGSAGAPQLSRGGEREMLLPGARLLLLQLH